MTSDRSVKRITIRLSALEDQNLRLEADGAGMNVSQLIRDRAIGHTTRAGCPLYPVIVELQRVGHALLALRDSSATSADQLGELLVDLKDVLHRAVSALDAWRRGQ